MSRCAARLPAWARVVPSAERKRDGGGLRAAMSAAQVVVSGEMMACSLEEGSLVVEGRRAWAVMVVMGGWDRSVERIWEPWGLLVVFSYYRV